MSKPADHCSFCDLVRGSAEVSVCYEDGVAIAFMDIQPVNPGHVLVVPPAARGSGAAHAAGATGSSRAMG